jgi:tetratricopeptide (TPR) repeat protein
MIAKDPQNAENYYRRADAIYLSSRAIGRRDVYIAKLNFALQDINMAISLQPDNGDAYYLRLNIYDKLAGTTDFIVDSQYLSKLALEDAYQESKLGTPFDYYPERTIINELIATDQCELALSNVKKSIEELPPNDISLGGLLHIRSRAYACLGRLDEALQSVNDSMFNNENMEYKNELKVQYLILLGRYEEALPMLDEQICHCELAGWHHYLRAEIYYNTGKKELVQDELFTGMLKTWGRGGMLPYVEAQLAQDEGRTEEAIQYLQLAEATFSDPIYNSLRWKVQEQLKALGVQPLVLTPSPTYAGTPIP